MTVADALPSGLRERFPEASKRPSGDCPAVTIPCDRVLELLRWFRDDLGFDMLMDLTAIDWDKESPRFTVVYHLFSSVSHGYLRIASNCRDDAHPEMPSATGLWPSADWHERECFDMFGIRFPGHADLRRILMWDGYPHHPLRKEFPLAGIETELPDPEVADVTKAKVKPAPMAGGPFVASDRKHMSEREPRAKDESWTESREKPR